MDKNRVVGRSGIRRAVPIMGVVLSLMANGLVLSATPANAEVRPQPSVVDAEVLTADQLTSQIKAAEALRAALMKSGAQVAVANTRLERLAAEATTLLADLSAARSAEVAAETEASAQEAHLLGLGLQVEAALNALGQLASDSYIRGGGALGDAAAIFEALTSPSADTNTDSMATVQYLVEGRARLFERLETLRSEQVVTSATAEAASQRASAAAKTAADAKYLLDAVIVEQRTALEGFRAVQSAQVDKAAGLRGALLRSADPVARAADKRLAEALQGQHSKLLMDDSSSCGKDSPHYPNGQLPASALCPLYAAPGQSLSRDAAMEFNAMSMAFEQQEGSPLCVAEGYRSIADQIVVKLATPQLAAVPGTSQHGVGLAVDLCGGVQSFASPAHLWMERNAPLYGWFQPAWAGSSGGLPEPWHWEFAS